MTKRPKTLQDLKTEHSEISEALAEMKNDRFADATVVADLKKDLASIEARITAAAGGDDAVVPDEPEEEEADDESAEGDAEASEEDEEVGDEEELQPFYEEDESSIEEDDSEDSDDELEASPILMGAKLRRDMGDLAADFLDEYAHSVQRKTINFFAALKAHLDLGIEDDSDGANNSLIELMLGDIGRKGVAKMRPHFADWREMVMRQLAKDMQVMFRAPEPELAEEVRVQVPKKNRAELIDGTKPNPVAPALNAPPPEPDPDAPPRARRVEAAVETPAVPPLVPGRDGVPMGLVVDSKVEPFRPANPKSFNPFDDQPPAPSAKGSTVTASSEPVVIHSSGRVTSSFRLSGSKKVSLE